MRVGGTSEEYAKTRKFQDNYYVNSALKCRYARATLNIIPGTVETAFNSKLTVLSIYLQYAHCICRSILGHRKQVLTECTIT